MADFSEADINNIDRMFDAMDIDHDGEISIKELVDGECHKLLFITNRIISF